MVLGLIFLFAVIFFSVAAFGYRTIGRSVRYEQNLDSMLAAQQPTGGIEVTERTEGKWLVRIVQNIGEKVPINPQDAGLARRGLIAAGYRTDTSIKVYYGAKAAMAVVGFIAALVGRGFMDNPILSVVVLFAGPFAGFFLPNLAVDRQISRRQERIRFALPDALDLLVVCMEAGLGLDQAIASVSRELKETHKDISDEWGLVTLEMRAGKRRLEALKNLADRVGEPDLRKLVATMIQADRFGTSVGESLRTHSDFMRVKRRQEAEERAAKVGVKLVFPIFFFILPAMLVVSAGPGILQLFKYLFPLMKGMS